MYNVIVIGAGNFGSRHLQGLAKSALPLRIDVVNRGGKNLKIARERFDEVRLPHVESRFLTDIPHGKTYDLALITCSSSARAKYITTLLDRSSVKKMVLEKFLFSREAEYEMIGNILNSRGVDAWVNCPRRMVGAYVALGNWVRPPVHVSVLGGMWGLGCNSIHMVDLVAWLCGDSSFSYDISNMDSVIHRAKRPGYIEFSGTLFGRSDRGTNSLSLVASTTVELACPTVIHILARNAQVTINEEHGTASLSRAEENWKEESIPFHIPFQSDLTTILAEDILIRKKCDLTSYQESSTLHLGLLKAFRTFYNSLAETPYEFAIT